ncbi:hypothetical protein JOM56_001101 [Amanita muscaria]
MFLTFLQSQRWNRTKILFLFVRYYTICLIMLNAIQIHLFTHKGYATNTSCVVFSILLRVSGGIAVWAVEILMQLRIYALFGCSRKIAVFNAVVFLSSVLSSLGIIIYDGVQRKELIAYAEHLPLPGCPDVNGGIQWAEWVPTTIYELILCSFALFELFQRRGWVKYRAVSTFNILINDNMLYFFGVTFVLVFNDLMVAGQTHIPWFSLGRLVFHLLRSHVTEVNFVDAIVTNSDYTKAALTPITFTSNLEDPVA